MQEYSNLGDWITGKWKSQVAFAEKIGARQGQVSRWVSGVNEISGDYQEKIRKAGYKGPWPEKKAKAGPAEIGEGYVTREEFNDLAADFEDACAVIQFLLSQVPPGSRPVVLPRKFRVAP